MLTAVAYAQRFVRAGVGAELEYQGRTSDGEPGDPGVVTVSVTRADGTVLHEDEATTETGSAPRKFALAADDVAVLDELTAQWKSGGTEIAVTKAAVVGGVYCTIAEAKAFNPNLNNETDTDIQAGLRSAENKIEEWCKRAFVPRVTVERVDGQGDTRLKLRWANLRTVKWARVYSNATAYTELTASELAAIPSSTGPVATRTDGQVWPSGNRNVELCYEHGHDQPTTSIARVSAFVAQQDLQRAQQGIDPQAVQYFPAEGGSVMLAQAGRKGVMTGIDWMDEILKTSKWKPIGVY